MKKIKLSGEECCQASLEVRQKDSPAARPDPEDQRDRRLLQHGRSSGTSMGRKSTSRHHAAKELQELAQRCQLDERKTRLGRNSSQQCWPLSEAEAAICGRGEEIVEVWHSVRGRKEGAELKLGKEKPQLAAGGRASGVASTSRLCSCIKRGRASGRVIVIITSAPATEAREMNSPLRQALSRLTAERAELVLTAFVPGMSCSPFFLPVAESARSGE